MNTKDLLLGGMVLGGGNGGGSVIIPNISATAESIDAGQDASVQQTGTDTNIVFNFQIPRGFDGAAGAQGPRGLTGAQGPVGATGPAGQSGQEGPAGPQGIQGPQGPAGAPFLIYKVYPTVDEMNAGFETDGIQEGQLVGISQETGGEQGGYLYIKGAKEYQFFFDINKIDGIQGPQGEQGPQGAQGAQGPAGKDGQTGPAGPQGENGVGVPVGGTTGQFLAKASDADYDTVWQDAPSGSGITLQSIQITTPPNQTEYNAGQTFNNTGMVVTAFYNYNLSQIVTGYTISPSGVLTGDITAVTITYSEGGVVKTATQPITVTRLTGTLSIDPTWVSLDADTQAAEVQVAYNGDGELSVQSSAPDVVSAEISGTTVTVKSLTDTSQTVTVTITAPETGTYTGATAKLTVENYVTAHVYGAEWDGSATTKWSRTDDAELFEDPEPAVNNGAGSSPFDGLMPWAGMEIVEDETAGTLVKIPKYWYKWTRSGAAMKLQISDAPQERFYTSPAHADRGDGQGERDFVYVGRYHCGEGYKSITDTLPLNSMTRAAARVAIAALGAEYWQYDYAMFWTIAALYLVEFADWNSQACIGYGCSPDEALFNSGLTDDMLYHTGTSAANRTTYGCCQYRHIEGLWDNVFDWVDGIYFSGVSSYCIKNPANFSDDSGGTYVGNRSESGNYISAWSNADAPGFEYAICPSAANGSASTYICDIQIYDSNGTVLYSGAYSKKQQEWGLFSMVANSGSDYAYFSIGCRLQKLPNGEVS